MSAARRRSNSAAREVAGKRARRAASVRRRRASLEYNILLTATLCLLAFGAVMVYSSSSASTLLQGEATARGELVKFVLYGALGLG